MTGARCLAPARPAYGYSSIPPRCCREITLIEWRGHPVRRLGHDNGSPRGKYDSDANRRGYADGRFVSPLLASGAVVAGAAGTGLSPGPGAVARRETDRVPR